MRRPTRARLGHTIKVQRAANCLTLSVLFSHLSWLRNRGSALQAWPRLRWQQRRALALLRQLHITLNQQDHSTTRSVRKRQRLLPKNAEVVSAFTTAHDVWQGKQSPGSGDDYKTFMQASIAFLCSAVFQNPRIPSTQAALLKVRHRARIPISSLPGKADLLQSRKLSSVCKKRMTAFSDDANFPACLLGTAAEMPPATLSDAGGSDSDESDGEDGIDAASSGGKAAADSGSTASRVPNSALPAKFVALTDAGCGNWCVACRYVNNIPFKAVCESICVFKVRGANLQHVSVLCRRRRPRAYPAPCPLRDIMAEC